MKRILLISCFVIYLSPLFAQREVFVKSEEAIRGYDPVAYFKERKPVKGKKEFSFAWRDATWLFSSDQNLEDFKSNPQKFAPQFGGYCAYGMMQGHKASTSPDAWTIVEDKLYLNYNTEVRDLWNKDQKAYIKTAIRNWPAVKLEKD